MYKLLGVHILLSTPGTHLPDVRRSSRLCRVVLHDRAQLCRQVARGCRCRLYLNTGVSHFVYSGCKLHFPTVHSAVQQYVDTYLKVGKAGHGRDQGLCQVASPTVVCVGRRRRSSMFNKYGCNRFPNYAKLPLLSARKLPGDWCYPSRPIYHLKGLATAHTSHTLLRWVVLLCCDLRQKQKLPREVP